MHAAPVVIMSFVVHMHIKLRAAAAKSQLQQNSSNAAGVANELECGNQVATQCRCLANLNSVADIHKTVILPIYI